MKLIIKKSAALLAAFAAAASTTSAQTILDTGDTDIGIGYETDWDLHVHKEDPPNAGEFEAADVILRVNGEAQTTVPSGSQWSFQGTAGDPVWVLPQTSDPNLLFLGFATEEIQTGIFINDEMTMSLSGVSGPGNFAVYAVSLGNPTVLMDSSDGISGSDSILFPVGTHQHFNFSFTAPGDYTISFEASGTLVADSLFTSSGPVDYSFTVVPEPGTWALLGGGLLAGACLLRRRGTARR